MVHQTSRTRRVGVALPRLAVHPGATARIAPRNYVGDSIGIIDRSFSRTHRNSAAVNSGGRIPLANSLGVPRVQGRGGTLVVGVRRTREVTEDFAFDQDRDEAADRGVVEFRPGCAGALLKVVVG